MKNRDKYFMDIAIKVSENSTCDRAKVGAVLVKNDRIKATGYNGSPSKTPHCDEVGHLMVDNHCRRTIHAEINCLLEASPEEREGATLYLTHYPCLECQKVIIQSKIKNIVVLNYYKPDIDIIFESSIPVMFYMEVI